MDRTTPSRPTDLSPRSAIENDIRGLKGMGINDRGIFGGDIRVSTRSYTDMSYAGPNLYAKPSATKWVSSRSEYKLEMQRHLIERALDLRDSIVAEAANDEPKFQKVKTLAEALLGLEKEGVDLDELKFSMGDVKIKRHETRYDDNDVGTLQAHLAAAAHRGIGKLIDGKAGVMLTPDLVALLDRFVNGLKPQKEGNADDSNTSGAGRTTTVDEFILGLIPTQVERDTGLAGMMVKQQREELGSTPQRT